jgi:hypothetical protein
LVGWWELDDPLGLGGADAAHEGELVDAVRGGGARDHARGRQDLAVAQAGLAGAPEHAVQIVQAVVVDEQGDPDVLGICLSFFARALATGPRLRGVR